MSRKTSYLSLRKPQDIHCDFLKEEGQGKSNVTTWLKTCPIIPHCMLGRTLYYQPHTLVSKQREMISEEVGAKT